MINLTTNFLFFFPGPSDKANYTGGEVRVDASGNEAFVSIAAEGPGGNNLKDAMAALLLQRVLGKIFLRYIIFDKILYLSCVQVPELTSLTAVGPASSRRLLRILGPRSPPSALSTLMRDSLGLTLLLPRIRQER